MSIRAERRASTGTFHAGRRSGPLPTGATRVGGEPGPLLLVAVSARMLAELAVRAGHDVVAVDHFGDRDLRALAPSISILRDLGGRGGMAGLVEAAAGLPAAWVIYGAGLENRPDLVARLGAGRELLGCPPAVLERVRDPFVLGASLRAAGLHVPDTFAARPPRSGRWLRKPLRGGGGRGVREWRGGALPSGCVVQERVPGTVCSLAAVADGRAAVVLGCSEQLVGRAALGAHGFAWCGNLMPPRVDDVAALERAAQRICAHVAAAFGLVGLFGVDFVWDGERAWVLEVNPRPTGSLELLELLGGVGVIDAHLAACAGQLHAAPRPLRFASPDAATAQASGHPSFGHPSSGHPPSGPPSAASCAPVRAAGKAIVYARADGIAPDIADWVERGVRDVPEPGEPIAAGRPVCTLLATGPSPQAVLAELEDRAQALRARLGPRGADAPRRTDGDLRVVA